MKMIFVLIGTVSVPDTSHPSLYFGLAILMLPVLVGLVCFAKNTRRRNQEDLYFRATLTFLRVKHDLKIICILNEQDGWQFWSSRVYEARDILFKSLRTALVFKRESSYPVFVYEDETSSDKLHSVADRVVRETELSNLNNAEIVEWIKKVVFVYLLISRIDWCNADSEFILPEEFLAVEALVCAEVCRFGEIIGGPDPYFVAYQSIQFILEALVSTCPKTLVSTDSIESSVLGDVSD